jgi:hypothetical protein
MKDQSGPKHVAVVAINPITFVRFPWFKCGNRIVMYGTENVKMVPETFPRRQLVKIYRLTGEARRVQRHGPGFSRIA